MENIYPKALYEGNWYRVARIDFQYQQVHLITGTGTAKISLCYIEKIEDLVLNTKEVI